LSEFERYLEGKGTLDASGVDTFIGCQAIVESFQNSKNNNGNVEPEQRIRKLRTHWNNKLYKDYLAHLGTVGIPLGVTELQLLGEVFGFECHYSTHGHSGKSHLNTAYGQLASSGQICEDSIQALVSRNVIFKQGNSYFFQKILDENKLSEKLESASDLVDPKDKETLNKCTFVEALKNFFASFQEKTINVLQERNILQSNKTIFSGHTDLILMLRLQKYPKQTLFYRITALIM
jgi:hypothetical protein